MSKESRAKRMKRRIEIHFGPSEPEFVGYSGNISHSGITVGATRVFSTGTILNLEVRLEQSRHRIRARVMWARRGDVRLLSSGKIGMGLDFVDPPEEFLEALRKLGAEAPLVDM